MNDLRLTLTDTGLIVHDGLYQRDLSPEEAAQVRDALDSPGLPLWLDLSAVAAIVLALVVMMRGGGV